jgi:hypothetical protein
MVEGTDLKEIPHVLRLAQQQINQLEPDLAIENLKRIRPAVDSHHETAEWAEYSLLLGEAFVAKLSPAAGRLLEEAEDRIGRLPDPAPMLQFRLHDRLGYFYQHVERKRVAARREYELAKGAALTLGVAELVARTQLRITLLDLEIDRSREIENFKTLRRVGHGHAFTNSEQLAAWLLHCGENDQNSVLPVYARGIQTRSDDYFLDLLRSVRVNQ